MATSSALDQVPATAVCTFVGEGRANIVFTLSIVDDDDHDDDGSNASNRFTGQLLRLPKAHAATKALPYVDLQHYWEARIKPLFAPTELVQQRLVRLPRDKAFFTRLNAQLRTLDASGTRRADFIGHSVREVSNDENDQLAMLVEDMRSSSTADGKGGQREGGEGDGGGGGVRQGGGGGAGGLLRMHEIKPKWLHQSPRAPPGATQCRNCAREVWRNKQNATSKPIFCPLNLVRAADFPGDEGVARDVAAEFSRCFGRVMTEAEAGNLARWLRGCALFQRLRRIQWEHDHGGGEEEDEDDYALAMTLRDCSLFVLVPAEQDAAPARVVAKLGDTDRKNAAVKKEYWRKMEKDFHDSGVYWNTDQLAVSLTACQLPFYRARMGGRADSELGRYYLV